MMHSVFLFFAMIFILFTIPNSYGQKLRDIIDEIFGDYKWAILTWKDYGLESGIKRVISVPYEGEWASGIPDPEDPYSLLWEGRIVDLEGEHFDLLFNKKGELVEEIHWNASGNKTYRYRRLNRYKAQEEFYEDLDENEDKDTKKAKTVSITYFYNSEGKIKKIVDGDKEIHVTYIKDQKVLEYFPEGYESIKVFSGGKLVRVYKFHFYPESMVLEIRLEDEEGNFKKRWRYQLEKSLRVQKREVVEGDGFVESTEYHYEGNEEEPIQILVYHEKHGGKELIFESKRVEKRDNKEVKLVRYWDGDSWEERRIEMHWADGNPLETKIFWRDGIWEHFLYNSKGHLIKYAKCRQDGTVKFEKTYEYKYIGRGNLWERKIIQLSDHGNRKLSRYIIVKREYQFW